MNEQDYLEQRWRLEAEKTRPVRSLIGRLVRRSRVRACAKALMETVGEAQRCDVEPLLAALRGNPEFRWKERMDAARALGQARLSHDHAVQAAQALCGLLKSRQIGTISRLSVRLVRAVVRTLAFVLCLGGVFFICASLWNALPSPNTIGMILMTINAMVMFFSLVCMTLTAFIPLLSLDYDAYCAHCVRTTALDALARLHVPCSVGTLAELCTNRRLQGEAMYALQQTLPTLRPDHEAQLDVQAVPNLCRLLNDPSETTVLAILEALKKVGDGRAVAPVERVAASGRTKIVREAAERILPLLRERQRQERTSGRLLRPSSDPSTPAETLLRPVSETTPSDPHLLLRRAGDLRQNGEE